MSLEACWKVFALAAATIFMFSLDAAVIVEVFSALLAQLSSFTPAEISRTIHGFTIVFAELVMLFGRWLDRGGCPPDLQEEAVKTELEQAELLCSEWV